MFTHTIVDLDTADNTAACRFNFRPTWLGYRDLVFLCHEENIFPVIIDLARLLELTRMEKYASTHSGSPITVLDGLSV